MPRISRERAELKDELIEFLVEKALYRTQQELESLDGNNLLFIWEGEVTVPWRTEALEAAFRLAGRADLLQQDKQYVLESYYITDEPQGIDPNKHKRNDSRAISNKYNDWRALLQPGETYYLCKK